MGGGNNTPYGAYTPGSIVRPPGLSGPYTVIPVQSGYMLGGQGGQLGGGQLGGFGGGQFGQGGLGGGQFGQGGFGGNKGFGFNGGPGI